jgi:D-arginine utilization repressor
VTNDGDTRNHRRARPTLDLTSIEPLILGIVALLHPYAEVVVHDVSKDRIAAIFNGVSGRKVGDASYLGEQPAVQPGCGVLGPYEKVAADGHRITSVTIEVLDGSAYVCINLDRHPLDEAIATLQRFAQAVVPRPALLFERDWNDEIGMVVDEWCRQKSLDRARLSKDQRSDLVGVLFDKGLFVRRNAAAQVAKTLGVSRATVYNALQQHSHVRQ